MMNVTELQKGDVIFVRGTSIISKLIRLFDRGEFSHVGIYLGNGHVLDAQYPNGVRIRHFRFKDYEVVRVPLDVHKAMDYIGFKYDWRLFFWLAFKVDKVWNTPNQFICSELIADATGDKGLLYLPPNELYQALINKQN